MRGSDYAELRAFAAIVEHGSFARAAPHLGMSTSALSQTIRKLEDRLGARLLNRTTRSVAPSAAGERLLVSLLPALRDLDQAVAGVREAAGQPAGTLRINTSRLAAVHLLAPRVSAFLQAHPLIEMEIVIDDRLSDIVASGCDAGIRLGEALEKDMIALPVGGPLRMVTVAAPDYLARHGTPAHPRDLLAHRCLNTRWPTPGHIYRWEFEKNGEVMEIATSGPLICTDSDVLLRAASDGLGVACLFDRQVQAGIDDGTLVPVLQNWTPEFPGLYLYYPDRRQVSPALRALIDHLRAVG